MTRSAEIPRRRRRPEPGTDGATPPHAPEIGNVIRKLRQQRGLSLRQVAERAELSASFLGAVERGESDISVGRLSLVAQALGHDIGSLLGYSLQQARPRFIRPADQVKMKRGSGVELVAIRIPGTSLELLHASLPAHTKDKPVTHAGLDILLVLEGNLVLNLDGSDYPLSAGECVVWPSSHKHAIRNDADTPARAIGIVTEKIY